MLWQTDAAAKMTDLIMHLFNVEEVKAGGSVNHPSTLDIYSDVDIKIKINDDTPMNLQAFLHAVAHAFAPVFGYEFIQNTRAYTLRLCLDNGA
ncbi:MAG: hypothetical protein FWC71_02670 [Defluviitaleaceae bacterium]|nr:hypothetical protein [Defluviitaleaceae bacterium]